MWDIRRSIAVVTSAGLVALIGLVSAGAGEEPKSSDAGQQSLHDGFETPQVVWEREHTDTTINLIAQDRSVRAAHDGNLSERFQFEADAGSQFFVSYALPAVPVTEKLEASLYVRADRIGVQLYGRVVLPADIDPETRAPSFVLIPGTIYDRVDRWQRLELSSMLPTIERQARVLRASSRRPVSLKGAYLDRLVVNLLGGSGASEVFLDDLSVTPVAPARSSPRRRNTRRRKQPPRSPGARGSQLADVRTGGTDGPAGAQPREAVRCRPPAPRLAADRHRCAGGRCRQAPSVRIRRPGRRPQFRSRADQDGHRARSFLLMPRLSGPSLRDRSQGACSIEIKAYPYKDSVAFWMVGEGLGRQREMKSREEELARTRKLLSAMRQLPAGYVPAHDRGSSTATCTSTRGRPATSIRSGSSRCSGPRRRS